MPIMMNRFSAGLLLIIAASLESHHQVSGFAATKSSVKSNTIIGRSQTTASTLTSSSLLQVSTYEPPPSRLPTAANDTPVQRFVPLSRGRTTYVWYNTDYEPFPELEQGPMLVASDAFHRKVKVQNAVVFASCVAYTVWMIQQLTATAAFAAMPNLGYLYKTYPLQAGVSTCGIKSLIADAISQVRRYKANDELDTFNFNLRESLSYITYGSCVLGAGSCTMYTQVMPRLFGGITGPLGIATRSCFDNFVCAPLFWLPGAYLIKSLFFPRVKYGSNVILHQQQSILDKVGSTSAIVGANLKIGVQNYVKDIKEKKLLFKYWSLWLPAQMITFSSLVPTHFRTPCTAGISFVWLLILMNLSSKPAAAAPAKAGTAAAE